MWGIESLQRVNDMRYILPVALVALSCSILNGCASVSPKGTTNDNSGWNEDLSASYQDAKDSPRYEEWRSCIQLLSPDGLRSVSELQGLFKEPHDAPQLLKNLKLAWEQDLLLQLSFYEQAMLQKFFAGSTITWKHPWTPLLPDVGYVVGELDSQVMQGMSVRIESRCWRTANKSPSGKDSSTLTVIGTITITGGPLYEMNLKLIRDVLGSESQSEIDIGDLEHGAGYGSDIKGSVLYTDWAKAKAEGQWIGMSFVFPRQWPYSSFVDNDAPLRIEVRDVHQRLLEK